MFWDKRAEAELCYNAKHIVQSELRGMVDNLNLSRANGIGFAYPICDICKRNVIASSQNACAQAMKNDKYDANQENLLIFDCTFEQNYNHVFHTRCLRNSIKHEIVKDKKANVSEDDIIK